jgi:hypothetical protein
MRAAVSLRAIEPRAMPVWRAPAKRRGTVFDRPRAVAW